ncbi:hypothetical protein FR932_10675 [Moritella marina ATCC 15381]|uniref:Porin family protein n=1 Tax=Moritella marina ATCC 15381 TaxID=1202962 RepID=A0A5J6WJR7_MORMI|nr:hypothetical protein [Moritella marina]QFI38277.1 hypothetical protein FR932_10675 [Moritella marina ATCC 15381]
MAKIKCISVLLLVLTCPFNSFSKQKIAVFLGSPMSGLQYQQDDLRFSLGLKDFGIAFDQTFSVAALLEKPKLAPLYVYLGAQLVDHHKHKVAVRSGIGFQQPFEQIILYAELGPSLYVVEDVDIKLEASLGIKIDF